MKLYWFMHYKDLVLHDKWQLLFTVKDFSKGKTVAMQMKWLHTVHSTSLSVDSTGYIGQGLFLKCLSHFQAYPQQKKKKM